MARDPQGYIIPEILSEKCAKRHVRPVQVRIRIEVPEILGHAGRNAEFAFLYNGLFLGTRPCADPAKQDTDRKNSP
jgi:hypothetical protein